jgi:secreted trypsin-like serine protease
LFNNGISTPDSDIIRRRRAESNSTGDHLQPPFQGRVIGGTVANVKQYPFFAALWIDGSHGCGASILTKDFVLTAAHCQDFLTIFSYITN